MNRDRVAAFGISLRPFSKKKTLLRRKLHQKISSRALNFNSTYKRSTNSHDTVQISNDNKLPEPTAQPQQLIFPSPSASVDTHTTISSEKNFYFLGKTLSSEAATTILHLQTQHHQDISKRATNFLYINLSLSFC